MSHYCVGVVVNKPTEEEVEKILAPYDENIRVEPYISRTKEKIIEDAKKYKEKCQEAKDAGEKLSDYRLQYINANTDEELYNIEREEYGDYDEDGNELSTYNPKSKWDWWCFGGRFYNGNDYVAIKDYQLFDIISDVRLEQLRTIWKYLNNEIELTDEELKELDWDNGWWRKEYYVERYGTFEIFVKAEASHAPYALVDENGWYATGEMGWFGCDSTSSEDIAVYYDFLEKFINDESNKDKYIVWVDCHI